MTAADMQTIFVPLFLAQAQAPGEAAQPGKSLLEHIASGGPIGWLIVALSMVGMGLVIAHLLQLRASKLAPPRVVDDLDRMLAQGDTRGALDYCREPQNECFLTRVFGSALTRCSRSAFGFLELRSALEDSGREEVARLYRAVDGIGLIAAVAPMMGLLGTVVGMVGAFDKISLSEGFAKPAQLAGNISVALITTVMGLIVAIPATALFSFFRNRIDSLASNLAEVTENLSSHLEQSPGQQPARPQAPRRPAVPTPAPGIKPQATTP